MNNNYQYTILMDHIRQNALGYFPGLVADELSVQLRGQQERSSAVLYRFEVKDDTQSYLIIVKVPVRNLSKTNGNGTSHEKPLLFQKADSQDMHRLQYLALTSIYEYFAHLDNERLGAIHVLDYLPQYNAIIMEESRDPSLQQLFFRENRLHVLTSENGLASAFRNAGLWLKEYHAMPKEEGVQIRHQHQDQYVESIVKLTDFLTRAWGGESFFKQTASIVTQVGREVLPEVLPLALGHGDYAMRNILIGSNARVTVLDTFAKWRVPIYEDIGYFLNALKTSYPQVISQGFLYSPSRIAVYEHAFLQGYFASGNLPSSTIRLYEILALLDKWSSVLNNYHRRSAKLKHFSGTKITLTSRYFQKRLKLLLNDLTEAELSGIFSAMERSF